MSDTRQVLCESVRTACLEAAAETHENARISGLCHEGGIDRALDAIRNVGVAHLIRDFDAEAGG